MKSLKICGYDQVKGIGKGAFGTVFKVIDDENHQYAFKLIKESPLFGIPSILEIDIMSRFSHPYLVHAIEVYTSIFCNNLANGELGILMPLAKSDLSIIFSPESIPEILVNPNGDSNRDLTFEIRLQLIWQIFRGVQFLHQMDIYHLDLKPGNILLYGYINDDTDPLTAKISDFGLTYYCPFPIKGCESKSPRFTPIYAPIESLIPESNPYQVLFSIETKEKYNYFYQEKHDIWSLGIIMIEILTGEHVFKNVNSLGEVVSLINKLFSKEKIDQTLNDYLSNLEVNSSKGKIIKLIKKMLSLEPEDRPNLLQILASGLFVNIDDQVNAKIYTPIIGDESFDDTVTYGFLLIKNFCLVFYPFDSVGVFFLAIDLYYRGFSFPNCSHSKENAYLMALTSIVLSRKFYSLKTNINSLLTNSKSMLSSNGKLKFTSEDIYHQEEICLESFGYIVYRTYIYEKAPNLKALLSAYSLLNRSDYLSLDLDLFFENFSLYQASKQVSIREYSNLLY